MNMPMAMSIVWDVVKNPNKSKKLAELLLDFDKVMGLKITEPIFKKEEEIPEEIAQIVEKRKQARANKDWATSDALRDELKEKGYNVKDSKDGMTIEKI